MASLTEEQKTEIREEVSRILEQSDRASLGGRFARVVQIVEGGPMIRTVPLPNLPTSPQAQSVETLVQVIARAVEVLGSSEKALRWINAPVRSLGDQTPVSLLSTTEGIARVEDALGRIEHGVW